MTARMIMLAGSLMIGSMGAQAAAFVCGTNINCEWLIDNKSEGEFHLFSTAALGNNPGSNPFDTGGIGGSFPTSFTSPNGFWMADFTKVNAGVGAQGAVVTVTGTFQHIKPADDEDQQKGGPYSFALTITAAAPKATDPPNTQIGFQQTEHPLITFGSHYDDFQSLLVGTPIAGNATNFNPYDFYVIGFHTGDPLALIPKGILSPEPGAGWLLGAGLAIGALLKARANRVRV
jgi:hypothetical protein